jgi:hypothetical protein
VNPDFAGINEYNFQKHLKQFDEQLSGAYVFASLVLPPLTFCDGRLGIHMRKGKTGGKTDWLTYGVAPFRPPLPSSGRQLIWADRPNENEALFTAVIPREFLLDVQRAEYSKKVTSLDVMIGEETTVDFIKLTLVY